MKVRIVKASKYSYWYADQVGKSYKVEDEKNSDGDYKVKGNSFIIKVKDAVPVPEIGDTIRIIEGSPASWYYHKQGQEFVVTGETVGTSIFAHYVEVNGSRSNSHWVLEGDFEIVNKKEEKEKENMENTKGEKVMFTDSEWDNYNHIGVVCRTPEIQKLVVDFAKDNKVNTRGSVLDDNNTGDPDRLGNLVWGRFSKDISAAYSNTDLSVVEVWVSLDRFLEEISNATLPKPDSIKTKVIDNHSNNYEVVIKADTLTVGCTTFNRDEVDSLIGQWANRFDTISND